MIIYKSLPIISITLLIVSSYLHSDDTQLLRNKRRQKYAIQKQIINNQPIEETYDTRQTAFQSTVDNRLLTEKINSITEELNQKASSIAKIIKSDNKKIEDVEKAIFTLEAIEKKLTLIQPTNSELIQTVNFDKEYIQKTKQSLLDKKEFLQKQLYIKPTTIKQTLSSNNNRLLIPQGENNTQQKQPSISIWQKISAFLRLDRFFKKFQ